MRVQMMMVAVVIAAMGCSAQREPSKPQRTNDAGPTPATPRAPMRLPDASLLEDASSASDGAAVAMPLLPNFTLACAGEPAGDLPDDPLSVWEAERAAQGALGHAATFSLRGAMYRVHGTGIADVQAPFTLHTGSIGSGLASFDAAAVEGVDVRGRIELYPGGAERGTLPASSGVIAALALKTVVVESGLLDGAIDVIDERIGNTDLYRANASISNLAVEGVHQAYLYPEGTAGLEERIAWMPSEAVVLREAASLTFYEAEVGSVRMAITQALDLDYQAFSVAGDFSSGSLDVEDVAVRGTPVAVFGHDTRLRAETDSIAALESFRLTQAVNDAGLVLAAAVEIVPEAPEVWVAPSETRVVRFHYRERSHRRSNHFRSGWTPVRSARWKCA